MTSLTPLLAMLLFAVQAAPTTRPADEFLVGADVSMIAFLEGRGAVYRHADGTPDAPERILVNAGANAFRIRLFVNPDADYDAPTNRGAIQDLPLAIALAKRVKASGARFILNLHYSDTWADPGRQDIPAAWRGLSLEALAHQVRSYTLDTLRAFDAAGVPPDLVQVGNETPSGMLWPIGQIVYDRGEVAQVESWRAFGLLVNAAIAAVREHEPPGRRIPVVLTVAPGEQWDGRSGTGLPGWFLGRLRESAHVTDFDYLGIDSYPTTRAQLEGLRKNLLDVATRHRVRVLVMETSYPWNDTLAGRGREEYDPATAPHPTTPEGQQAFLAEVIEMVRSLPDGMGAGVLWWYPEAVPVQDTYIWKGGALGLFDADGRALPAMKAFASPASTSPASPPGSR
jgi:arabinogalactan endo-1,4-beta-galactosidase